MEFQKVRVFPDSAEDLASIGELRVSVKLFPLLTGSIRMGRLSLSDANITLVKKDSTANYDFLFGRKEAVDTVEQKADSGTLVETIDRVFQRVFQVVPDDLELQRVSLSFQDSTRDSKLSFRRDRLITGITISMCSSMMSRPNGILRGIYTRDVKP